MREGQTARRWLPLALLLPVAGCVLLQPVPRKPLSAPFSLAPEQQSELSAVLKRRDQHLPGLKSLSCSVTRFTYDDVFGEARRPSYDRGELQLTAPRQGKLELRGERKEKCDWDATSFHFHDSEGRTLSRCKLPPDWQHWPFEPALLNLLFMGNAEELQSRYHWRIATPHGCQGQIWLEGHPRFTDEAAWISRVDLILGADDMLLRAAQIHHDPRGRHRTVWVFEEMTRDARSPDYAQPSHRQTSPCFSP